jgi:hypothetical protein
MVVVELLEMFFIYRSLLLSEIVSEKVTKSFSVMLLTIEWT